VNFNGDQQRLTLQRLLESGGARQVIVFENKKQHSTRKVEVASAPTASKKVTKNTRAAKRPKATQPEPRKHHQQQQKAREARAKRRQQELELKNFVVEIEPLDNMSSASSVVKGKDIQDSGMMTKEHTQHNDHTDKSNKVGEKHINVGEDENKEAEDHLAEIVGGLGDVSAD
jgi:hypothetical protein